jgi:hypothetical protein
LWHYKTNEIKKMKNFSCIMLFMLLGLLPTDSYESNRIHTNWTPTPSLHTEGDPLQTGSAQATVGRSAANKVVNPGQGTTSLTQDIAAIKGAIGRLAQSPIHTIDGPHTAGDAKFFAAVGHHVNGMARIGDNWITNYPNEGREVGRLLVWNENTFDYQDPHTFSLKLGMKKDDVYPSGMDGSNRFLAVAYASDVIKFFEFNGTNIVEKEALEIGDEVGREDVGLAYHPGEYQYYLITNRELYRRVGMDWSKWERKLNIGVDRGAEESTALVHVKGDLFVYFAFGTADDPIYGFYYSILEIKNGTCIKHDSGKLTLTNKGSAMGAPSFRWAGTVTFDQNVFRMYAAPKRLDSSGNFHMWTAELDQAQPATENYDIRINTADVKTAGTNSSIYITINGKRGSTDEQVTNRLISGDAFEQGSSDFFTLRNVRNVGDIESVTLRSDNYEASADWLPQAMEISPHSNRNGTAVFQCNKWLKNGSLKQTFNSPAIKYIVQIKTSDVGDAGTDANVYLRIQGNKGQTDEIRLNSLISGNAFERLRTDQVEFFATDVGAISNITIRHDNSHTNPGWHLSNVKVYKGSTGTTPIFFDANRWLESPNLSATLSPGPVKIDVEVTVRTSNIGDAGTDANVYVTVFGTKGSTGEHRLNGLISGNAFERGSVDRVILRNVNDIGTPTRVVIRHDNSGSWAGWHLQSVEARANNSARTFNCNCWVESGALSKTLN